MEKGNPNARCAVQGFRRPRYWEYIRLPNDASFLAAYQKSLNQRGPPAWCDSCIKGTTNRLKAEEREEHIQEYGCEETTLGGITHISRRRQEERDWDAAGGMKAADGSRYKRSEFRHPSLRDEYHAQRRYEHPWLFSTLVNEVHGDATSSKRSVEVIENNYSRVVHEDKDITDSESNYSGDQPGKDSRRRKKSRNSIKEEKLNADVEASSVLPSQEVEEQAKNDIAFFKRSEKGRVKYEQGLNHNEDLENGRNHARVKAPKDDDLDLQAALALSMKQVEAPEEDDSDLQAALALSMKRVEPPVENDSDLQAALALSTEQDEAPEGDDPDLRTALALSVKVFEQRAETDTASPKESWEGNFNQDENKDRSRGPEPDESLVDRGKDKDHSMEPEPLKAQDFDEATKQALERLEDDMAIDDVQDDTDSTDQEEEQESGEDKSEDNSLDRPVFQTTKEDVEKL